MKSIIFAMALAGLNVIPADAGTMPAISNDGDNLCIEYNVGHMWTNASWEKLSEFTERGVVYTPWLLRGSSRTKITYKALVKTFDGRIIPMLCQLPSVEK